MASRSLSLLLLVVLLQWTWAQPKSTQQLQQLLDQSLTEAQSQLHLGWGQNNPLITDFKSGDPNILTHDIILALRQVIVTRYGVQTLQQMTSIDQYFRDAVARAVQANQQS